MLRTTEIKTAAATRISPRRLLVALLPVLALLVALAPASAMAQTGSGTSGDCTATVRTDNDTSEVARITVDCGNGVITNVNLRTNGRNEGTLEGDNGTTCDPDQVNVEFDCQPGSGDAVSIRAQFDEAQGEAVCLNPVLAVDFVVTLEDDRTETIDNVEASGCSDSSGSEGGGGEDDGTTPEGGVDSGAGGTAKPSDTAGVAGPLSGAALILLALASGGLLLRKTRTTP
jgi:hypothetical protein